MVAIYTACFGDYDKLRDPYYIQPDVDYIVFTDKNIKSDVWNVCKIPCKHRIKDARMFKINPHKFLPGYDITLWHDANIQQRKDISHLLNLDKSIKVMSHPHRNCVYEEAKACIRLKKDYPALIANQVIRYSKEKYPKNAGMVATGVIVRENNEEVAAFNNRWWHEVNTGSIRDQLSFNYCLQGLEIDLIPYNTIENNEFRIERHLRK